MLYAEDVTYKLNGNYKSKTSKGVKKNRASNPNISQKKASKPWEKKAREKKGPENHKTTIKQVTERQ